MNDEITPSGAYKIISRKMKILKSNFKSLSDEQIENLYYKITSQVLKNKTLRITK